MFSETVRELLQSIGLLPHQVEFAEEVISARRPARFVLAAPPGLGKSYAIAAVVRMLASQSGGSIRCLVIVPAALQALWVSILRTVGAVEPMVMNAPAYRRVQAETPSEQNPWGAHPCIVTSIDFLKKARRVDEALAVPWVTVVLDEAHQCSAGSRRGAVAKELWETDGVPVAIAATTFADQPEWLVRDPNVNVVRWSTRAVKDWDGMPIFPSRRVAITTYQLSPLEQELDARLHEFLGGLPDGPSVDFVRRILLRRWQSSLHAIEQSLRTMVARAEEPDVAFDESEEAAAAELTDVLLALPNAGLTAEACQELLDLVEQIPEDSKWAACESLLRTIRTGEERSVVIFTEFADTAEYVSNLAESQGWPTQLITVATPVETRWRLARSAQAEPAILIVTTAATEGLNLSVSDQALHYDLPEEPMRLLQRYGRLERLGSRFPVVCHHVLAAEGSAVKSIFDRLQHRVHEMEDMFERE